MPTAYGRRREVSSDLKRRTQPHERYTASTTANSNVAAHVSKETRYEGLKTLCRNHRERRRPVVNVSHSNSSGRALPLGPDASPDVDGAPRGAASENRVRTSLAEADRMPCQAPISGGLTADDSAAAPVIAASYRFVAYTEDRN